AAQENGVLDRIHEELGQVDDALREDRDLQLFFFSPYFTSEEKKDAIGRVIEGADERLVNFLELLTERHRMPLLPRIRRHLDAKWAEENKLLPVSVTSAIDLD